MARQWTLQELESLTDEEVLENLAALLAYHEADFDASLVNFSAEDVDQIWLFIHENQKRERSASCFDLTKLN